ncbi:retron Ec67 family RNA-directed DNA polymerase/endonuclease [Chromobacterium violaceum]|uniref:retron Ec67 family RNA-directed DNA polymerase/endonuclease n=1 Tax=Chromobacterium violaceum TaxID=536 RepID=UPI00195064F0|nr:retron Ec67 family RNA-directed DNA polymerase/endonuclease [Chromobacterium violaceum]QRO34157.1 retron Ec67 family RNA-directed DNA polymerase/endonuclease [Chromobacterium violaceum]QRQ16040.1 retron Ec67 family RNA-directed DNA polymerase/endonuclease [Chromobacterium violaceum]
MSNLNKLKNCETRADLADLLGFKASSLAYILYKMPPEKKYEEFLIPKKAGGNRSIAAPCPGLKKLQKRLCEILTECYQELYGGSGIKKSISHGFRPKHSVITNSLMHQKRRRVLNLDLKDFFPSINFGRVRGYFIKNKDFAISSDVATVIAQIACHDGVLPQGAPTSPVISNLVLRSLDLRLLTLAKKNSCFYTRYADDITFSTNKTSFPEEIAIKDQLTHKWDVGGELESTILRSGFQVNDNKTRVMYKVSRQEVTGLIVNKRVSTREEYRDQVRSMVYSLTKRGEFYFKQISIVDGQATTVKEPGDVWQLDGMLNYIYNVDMAYLTWAVGEKKVSEKKDKDVVYSAREQIYRKFLFYTLLCKSESPYVICEGVTDDIYIRCALSSLVGEFPTLRVASDEKKIKLKFFNHSKKMKYLLGMGGGTGDIKKFLIEYKAVIIKTFSERPSFPVIVIVDNDSGFRGSKGMYSWVRANAEAIDGPGFGIGPKAKEGFYFVKPSLYIVPIPRGEESEVAIEDLLPSKILTSKIGGKEVNLNNNGVSSSAEIGKTRLVEHVRKNRKDIDFGGFRPLLRLIEGALTHYDAATKSGVELVAGPNAVVDASM